MSDEAPWPRTGDVLFSGDGGWLNACVGWTRDQWFGYAEGYRRAADVLVQHVSETLRDQDFLIYPIVFLYRQAIEISLKHNIWSGTRLVDRPANLPTHHLLVPLWQQCRPLIEEIWPEGPKEDLDAVGAVLDQFEARDRVSTVFRYPVTKEGRPALSTSERIDIRNFAEVANRVFSLLDGCASGFREYLHYKWDSERECSW